MLITAANSTVGLAAIQIARTAGAIQICTAEKLLRPVLEAGADAVIVMQSEDLAQGLAAAAPNGIDAVFDAVDEPQVAVTAVAIRPRGTIVIHGGPSNEPTQFR